MAPPQPSRTNDPERTMGDILDIATREFAEKGLSGARIDAIASEMQSSKRMIYYYFEHKEGLYLAVLENAYRKIRAIEGQLDLEGLAPVAAMRTLVGFSVDYHFENPDFVRLVMNENMHKGAYLAQSEIIQALNKPAIASLRKVYARGCASGDFRDGIDPVDLHRSISALSFHNVSNQFTFSIAFKRDMASLAEQVKRRESIVEMIMRFVAR